MGNVVLGEVLAVLGVELRVVGGGEGTYWLEVVGLDVHIGNEDGADVGEYDQHCEGQENHRHLCIVRRVDVQSHHAAFP